MASKNQGRSAQRYIGPKPVFQGFEKSRLVFDGRRWRKRDPASFFYGNYLDAANRSNGHFLYVKRIVPVQVPVEYFLFLRSGQIATRERNLGESI